jgi:hypothetical protein
VHCENSSNFWFQILIDCLRLLLVSVVSSAEFTSSPS